MYLLTFMYQCFVNRIQLLAKVRHFRKFALCCRTEDDARLAKVKTTNRSLAKDAMELGICKTQYPELLSKCWCL